jgi:hypothetical protein
MAETSLGPLEPEAPEALEPPDELPDEPDPPEAGAELEADGDALDGVVLVHAT